MGGGVHAPPPFVTKRYKGTKTGENDAQYHTPQEQEEQEVHYRDRRHTALEGSYRPQNLSRRCWGYGRSTHQAAADPWLTEASGNRRILTNGGMDAAGHIQWRERLGWLSIGQRFTPTSRLDCDENP